MPQTEYWEFLLQQEGDDSWLPLESPDVEILQGRYRIAARSSHCNATVEIQITHESFEVETPRRRFQKRSQLTDPQGFMVVVPFTAFEPGNWEISCFSDGSSLYSDRTQYSVQLYVLSKETDIFDDWDPSWEPSLHGNQGIESVLAGEPDTAVFVPPESVPAEPSLAMQETAPIQALPTRETLAPQPHPSAPPILAKTSSPTTPAEPNNPDSSSSPHPSAATSIQANTSPEPVSTVFSVQSSRLAPPPLPLNILQPAEKTTTTNPEQPTVAAWLELIEQQSEQIADDVLKSHGFQPAHKAAPTEKAAPTGYGTPANTPATTEGRTPLILALQQTAYIVQHGQTVTLAGDISLATTAPVPLVLSAARLKVRLFNPQTAETLLETRELIRCQTLPWQFTHRVTVPFYLDTRLILGEITLHDLTLDNAPVLANQTFTLNADATELLEVISEERITEGDIEAIAAPFDTGWPEPGRSASQPENDLGTPGTHGHGTRRHGPGRPPLDLISTAQSPFVTGLKPANPQPLPPHLSKSPPPVKPAQPTTARVQLPTFLAKSSSHHKGVFCNPEDTVLPLTTKPSDNERQTKQQTSEWHQLSPAARNTRVTNTQVTLESATTPTTSEASNQTIPIDTPTQNASAQEIPTQEISTQATPIQTTTNIKSSQSPDPVTVNDPLPAHSPLRSRQFQDQFLSRLNFLATSMPSEDLSVEEPESVQFKPEVHEELELNHLQHPIGETPPDLLSAWTTMKVTETGNPIREFIAPGGSISRRTEEGLAPVPMESTAAVGLLLNAPDAEVATDEFVVDDEPILPLSELHLPQRHSCDRLEPHPTPLLLPEHQPVPMPALGLLTPKVIADRPIQVKIQLPKIVSKVYVKVWIYDRQNQLCLDGPHWVVTFNPGSAEGQLEAVKELVVPPGCLDIQIAAIAVEMVTKRESHKATLDCAVASPQVPDLSLEDFNFYDP